MPGIGSTTGERLSSHASFTAFSVTPRRWRAGDGRPAVAAEGVVRHERDPLAFAVVEHVVVFALGQVVLVLHRDDVDDAAGALDLFHAHRGHADMADRAPLT